MRWMLCAILLGGCSVGNVGDPVQDKTSYECIACHKQETADTKEGAPLCCKQTMVPADSVPTAYACAKCNKERTVARVDAAPVCPVCKAPMAKK